MTQPTLQQLTDDGSSIEEQGRHAPVRKFSIYGVLKYTSIVILVAVGLYLVIMPFVPILMFYAGKTWGELGYGPFAESTAGESSAGGRDGQEDEIPEENTLRIASIGVDLRIVEDETEEALSRGAWHRPGTGDPVQGGNMVVTGHRFKYLPPSNLTFYHLDKVRVGDDIVVYWDGTRYDYTVTEITVVEPSQVEVEADTADPRLTLYTCTPLWTAKQRLVVIAKPHGWGENPGEGQTVNLEPIDE